MKKKLRTFTESAKNKKALNKLVRERAANINLAINNIKGFPAIKKDKLMKKKNKKSPINKNKDKLYYATMVCNVCFVSDQKDGNLKSHARMVMGNEFDNATNKLALIEVKTLKDIPSVWHNLLPWDLPGEDYSVKEIIANPNLLSQTNDPEYNTYLKLKEKFEK